MITDQVVRVIQTDPSGHRTLLEVPIRQFLDTIIPATTRHQTAKPDRPSDLKETS
jgi:hypothetical protein